MIYQREILNREKFLIINYEINANNRIERKKFFRGNKDD